jgi:hypothetical protein
MKYPYFLLAVPATIVVLFTGCTPPQAQAQQKFASEPTILIKAVPTVVMPVLQKEVSAAYSGCEITQIDANRLRAANVNSQRGTGTGSTLFTLIPQGADATLIKVTLLTVTPQGAMALPWLDGTKELFLKTGILDQTKAGAEAPKS